MTRMAVRGWHFAFMTLCLFSCSLLSGVSSFTARPELSKRNSAWPSVGQSRNGQSSLFMGNDLFESFKRLWGDGGDNEDGKGNDVSDDEDEAAGTYLIASIPGALLFAIVGLLAKK